MHLMRERDGRESRARDPIDMECRHCIYLYLHFVSFICVVGMNGEYCCVFAYV